MAYKEFGTEQTRVKEPVRFKLLHEEFIALPDAPAGVVNDLTAAITLDDHGGRVYSAPNLVRFVIGVLVEERATPIEEGDEPEDVDGEIVTVAEATERGVWCNPDWHVEKVLISPADDVVRFLELINSKRHVVRVETLGELVMWLAEELTGRPTVPSGRSSPGRR